MLILVGCSSNDAPAPKRLVKIDGQPRQDTDRARILNQRASDLIVRSDYKGAENLLKQAVVADPEFGAAQNNLGVVYYHQSKLYAAAQQFLLAAALLPHDPEPRNGLGLVFESSGRFDDAITYYDRARSLAPGRIEYLANCARAHVRRGDQTDEVKTMLATVAASDLPNSWILWARDTLKQMNRSAATQP
jgi:Flp pilus assembly protein TadD